MVYHAMRGNSRIYVETPEGGLKLSKIVIANIKYSTITKNLEIWREASNEDSWRKFVPNNVNQATGSY